MIAGLLEGAAFLAARVQLKIKSEFPSSPRRCSTRLLPDYPRADPLGDLIGEGAALQRRQSEGRHALSARGAYVDAVYLEQQRRVSCRYRLCGDLAIWPLHLEAAQYYPAAGPLQALGLEIGAGRGGGCACRSGTGRPTGWKTTSRASSRPARRFILPRDDACRSTCSAREVDSGPALRAALRQLQAHHHPLSRRVRRSAVSCPAARLRLADRLRRGRRAASTR